MKTLSLNRPLLLMIVGLPGAGKSFFARQFSDTFGVPVVSANRIAHVVGEDSNALHALADYQIGELLKTKRSFLVDGLCNSRAERQALEKLANTAGYGTLIIWVQTDEPTAKFRASKRSVSKPDDAYNQSITSVQFAAIAKQFAPPQRETYVVISGKHAYSTQAKMVLRKLATPHAEEAEEVHKQQTEQPRPTPRSFGSSTPRRSVMIR